MYISFKAFLVCFRNRDQDIPGYSKRKEIGTVIKFLNTVGFHL